MAGAQISTTVVLLGRLAKFREVLECASPLALSNGGRLPKRQRTAALQDAAARFAAPHTMAAEFFTHSASGIRRRRIKRQSPCRKNVMR